ncbi:MAG: DUF3465 domain-containing protein [Desulfobacteraceae bacterium]|nr:DUF3465 domain-containing protein [Desulfobacteraceae bacterium]
MITFRDITYSNANIVNAFSDHKSNIQVSGQGVVTSVLPDDNTGSRHQKFIIKLSSGQTLLVADNIDLANRINSLSKGDSIQFYGEYLSSYIYPLLCVIEHQSITAFPEENNHVRFKHCISSQSPYQ